MNYNPSTTHPSALQIYEWIDFAVDRNDVIYLSNLIRVRWNNRFTQRFGDARIAKDRLRGRIRLSPMIWERATSVQRRETIIHETCHIIAWHLHGTLIKPHGSEWRTAMTNCGVHPEIYHQIDLEGINRFLVRECRKEKRCYVSRKKLGELRRGQVLFCSTCGMRVEEEQIEC